MKENNKEYSLSELERMFDSDLSKGLDDSTILKNRTNYGKNVLEEKKKKPLWIKFLLEFKDPLIIILIIAAIVSIIIDLNEWIESLIIMIVVLLNAILGLYQENKAEKSLDALKKLSVASSKVVRNNSIATIDAKELVVGDIIIVEAGDSIPADARIIECSNLKVDEAALTGESVSVDKTSDYIEESNISLGDKKNCLFSSTNVTNGNRCYGTYNMCYSLYFRNGFL